MTPEVWLEIFGYLGMVVVLISFFLSDLKTLRIVNMVGGIICLIYGILTKTFPTALLNASLVAVNCFKLVRHVTWEKKNPSNKDSLITYNEEEKKEEDI